MCHSARGKLRSKLKKELSVCEHEPLFNSAGAQLTPALFERSAEGARTTWAQRAAQRKMARELTYYAGLHPIRSDSGRTTSISGLRPKAACETNLVKDVADVSATVGSLDVVCTTFRSANASCHFRRGHAIALVPVPSGLPYLSMALESCLSHLRRPTHHDEICHELLRRRARPCGRSALAMLATPCHVHSILN